MKKLLQELFVLGYIATCAIAQYRATEGQIAANEVP